MKQGVKVLMCLASGSLALCAGLAMTADPAANPYQGIVDRNVFGLKPPPPPPPPPEEINKPKEVKIILTGITTILGNKRVLMKTPAEAAKPGQKASSEKYYILTEGQAEDDIEILQINEKTGDVKLKNAGNIMTLNLEKDGVKPPSGGAPAPGAPPGSVPLPTLPGAMPGANPATPTGFSQPGNLGFPMPSRTPRVPSPPAYNAGITPSPSFSSVSPTPGQVGTPNVAVPVGALAQPPSSTAGFKPWPPPEDNLSLEEKAILMEKQRMDLLKAGNPAAGLIPPPFR